MRSEQEAAEAKAKEASDRLAALENEKKKIEQEKIDRKHKEEQDAIYQVGSSFMLSMLLLI